MQLVDEIFNSSLVILLRTGSALFGVVGVATR